MERLLALSELKGILPATGLDPDEAMRRARDEHFERRYGPQQTANRMKKTE